MKIRFEINYNNVMQEHFMDKLIAQIEAKNSVLCLGIDPHWEQIPERAKDVVSDSDFNFTEHVITNFCTGIIDACYDLVPIIKPNAAFFERFGWQGMHALHKIVNYAHTKGLLVIIDAKRGDIGSTSQAYAQGMLGLDSSGLHGDALTVAPYMGSDSISPFIEVASDRYCGLFVLLRTSNPGANDLQELLLGDDPLWIHTARLISSQGERHIGKHGFSLVGAVVGATAPEQGARLREMMPQTFFLVPGYGAQGATANELSGFFNSVGLGAIVNSSRGITFAYKKEKWNNGNPEDWQKAARSAC